MLYTAILPSPPLFLTFFSPFDSSGFKLSRRIALARVATQPKSIVLKALFRRSFGIFFS
ncbi:hypothetical protein M406DRAFT_61997 [Cryphonectria parasitica EP155]|uniref:Uncharacterized protein n=1 Tax=Cryphonectria parasitica (strain ATCC 38755 / EP155) TaxID=660469 RepID=A0A9P5CPG2_CRYP1|nr:uncharacterized protein M406DRAFT_61997 [Cryphonectria parasitica EP155]KAF3764975.1 hypothetical protein M406DRAFT_61997 [Cryphonectria parasitica EP155]